MARILITGGAGFVGSNLAHHMIEAGHDVTLFDNLSRRGSALNLAWLGEQHGEGFRFIKGDVRDAGAIVEAAHGQEVIYHTAAQTAVTTSVRDPREDFEINAQGTFNTLEAARNNGVERPIFIMTSTNKVYGGMEDVAVEETATGYRFPDLPQGVDESRPLDFHSPYGCSKGAADQYVRDYSRIYGLRSVVFRMSCIYGPHQWGMEDQAWVAWLTIQALKGRPITIYGDGKQVRDILYVDDLVHAFEAATKRIDVAAGQIYNLGGGPENALSIWQDLRPVLSAALGSQVPEATYADWRPGDQKIYVSNTAKAGTELGWTPEVGIEEGVARLVAWARCNTDSF
ncbi:MAG TPA: GDP-mannose 4,6-dehydratase [Chloroflexota bacterium]|nr:GDP-mannose 4,6-dehydratase [Chloroflexota bacterium]